MKKIFVIILAALTGGANFSLAKTPDTVVIDHATCQALVRYAPADDVMYQPGVDVHGKPVVEADINATSIKPPEIIRFNISVDVAAYAGIDVPAGTEMQANAGTVEVAPDGRMTFNGAPVGGDAEAALHALCKEARKKPKNQQKPSLQKRSDIIYNR